MPIIDAVLGDFFWRALIGGLGVALIAGLLRGVAADGLFR